MAKAKTNTNSKADSKAGFNAAADAIAGRTSMFEDGTAYSNYGGETDVNVIAGMLALPPGKRYTHAQLVNRIADLYEIDLAEARARLESDSPIEALQRVESTSNPDGATVPGGMKPKQPKQPKPKADPKVDQESEADPEVDQEPVDADPSPENKRTWGQFGKQMVFGDGKGGRVDRAIKGVAGFFPRNPITSLGIAGTGGLYVLGGLAKDESDKTKGYMNNPAMTVSPGVGRVDTTFRSSGPAGGRPPAPPTMGAGQTVRSLVGLPELPDGQLMMPMAAPTQLPPDRQQMPIPAGTQPQTPDNVKPANKAKEQST